MFFRVKSEWQVYVFKQNDQFDRVISENPSCLTRAPAVSEAAGQKTDPERSEPEADGEQFAKALCCEQFCPVQDKAPL